MLEDRDESIPLEALQEIEEFVDERAARVEEHDDKLDQIDHLAATAHGFQERIGSLTREKNQLCQEVETFREERNSLLTEKRQLETKVGKLEDEESSYAKGYADGKHDWPIAIPCCRCGGSILICPGETFHQAIVDYL